MANKEFGDNNGTEIDVNRRSLMRRTGLGMAGAAALAVTGLATTSKPANATNQGAGPPDADIFNFALNLEYLEASFYLYAVTGQGLPSSLMTGTGTQGTVSPGAAVPFKSPAIQQYAKRIAVDEQAHVNFIRAVLTSSSVAVPAIDVSIGPNSSFSKLAVAAGLIVQGQTFNPYADDVSFLLGASIFEDVGVTAYAGAAALIGTPAYVTAAACILAVEAYHAGAIRTLLANIGGGVAFDAIAALRATLSQASDEAGILIPGENYNFDPTDDNGLVFRRTPGQVLNVVYGNTTTTPGLFFPNGMNGNIR